MLETTSFRNTQTAIIWFSFKCVCLSVCRRRRNLTEALIVGKFQYSPVICFFLKWKSVQRFTGGQTGPDMAQIVDAVLRLFLVNAPEKPLKFSGIKQASFLLFRISRLRSATSLATWSDTQQVVTCCVCVLHIVCHRKEQNTGLNGGGGIGSG